MAQVTPKRSWNVVPVPVGALMIVDQVVTFLLQTGSTSNGIKTSSTWVSVDNVLGASKQGQQNTEQCCEASDQLSRSLSVGSLDGGSS